MPKILCVIVLYNCLLKDSKTYRTFNPKSKDLLVFDNSEQTQDISIYASAATYVHNEKNIGLSACYNRAAEFAQSYGYDWLLLVDQDTDFSDVSVNDYVKAINENRDCQLFAPMVKCGKYTMSPTNMTFHFAHLSNKNFQGLVKLQKLSIINSGLCVSVDAFYKCGGYNEKVFLDYSDHEFLRRFKRNYYKAFILPKNLQQDFSVHTDSKEKSFARFRLFCKSIRGCKRDRVWDDLCYSFVVIKRACSLALSFRSFSPFFIVLKTYYND